MAKNEHEVFKCEASLAVDYSKKSPMVRMCMKPATHEYQGPHVTQLWPAMLCNEHYEYFKKKDETNGSLPNV